MTQQEALMVLNAVGGLGPIRIRELMAYFGSPTDICSATLEELHNSHLIPAKIAQNIVHFSKDKFLSAEYNLMQTRGVEVITCLDDLYPCSLKEIPYAPLCLYVKGQKEVLGQLSIAMVGARQATFYGKKTAKQLAGDLARAGVVVASGLARGIDTASHQGCLEAGGKTIAVVGCGLNHVYPQENKALMEKIALQGAVVSELAMDMPPVAQNFPRRNRLIIGLSKSLVVVEAAERSGALITVDFALEQGKDVFVVPGLIDNPMAQGSNRLMKDRAKVVLCSQDILAEFLPPAAGFKNRLQEPQTAVSLTQEEIQGYQCISSDPMHFEQLLEDSGLSLSQLTQAVLQLEMKQIIRQLPGQYYVRV